MKIGIVGGTGAEGSGLALRWARAGHEVTIGSRDAARGEARAAELSAEAGVTIRGSDNEGCCAASEVVLLSVPYGGHHGTVEGLKASLAGKIVIDITVPLKPPKVRSVQLPEGQAAALEAQSILGDTATVVAAFHHISAGHLSDLEHTFDCDVLVCSNDREARDKVVSLVFDLGLRGVHAGMLSNAIALESLTPVLLFINSHYKQPGGAGIRITGIPDLSA